MGALTVGDGVTLTLATTGPGSVAVSPAGVALGSGMTSFAPGTLVTLTPQPQAGAEFIGWAIDGALADWANPLTITLATSHTVQATFAARPSFGDMAAGTPAAEAVAQLTARGIIKGYGDGTFGPADPVARAQIAALIVRAFGWDSSKPERPRPVQRPRAGWTRSCSARSPSSPSAGSSRATATAPSARPMTSSTPR